MKIIQLNTEFGYRLPAILSLIKDEQPDILCCQEAFSAKAAIPLSPIADSFQTLQKIMESGVFNHYFFAPTWGTQIMDTTAEIGNAIFSKLPLADQRTIFASKEYISFQKADDYVSNIRNLQICSVKINNHHLNIANHQGFLVKDSAVGGEETVIYTQKVADSLQPYTNSLIFCGDLNIVKESLGFAPIASLGLRNLTAENGIKTTLSEAHRALNKDSVACDYIFCSNNIEVKKFSVSDKIVSDHKALILEFDV